jgi:Raf kinase inhibitor-like YbhB/YbcL family protein
MASSSSRRRADPLPARQLRLRLVALVLGIGLAACSQPVTNSRLTLRSDAFDEGGSIPVRYSCDAEDVSPPLSWSGAPAETGAFALIVRDADAGNFVHWVLTDIPADVTSLPDGMGDTVGIAGRNDFGRVGWGGPCPPSGEHHYEFTLYALTAPLQLDGAPEADEVERAFGTNLLAEAKLTGTFTR